MARKEKEKNEKQAETETNDNAEAVTESTETTTEKVTEKATGNGAETPSDKSETPTCEERYAELNNKYIRLYSDFDNFRKRTIKERADTISSASADVIKELLVVLDDFERAITNNEKVEDPATLKEGFKLIQHKLLLALQSKGLELTEAKGEVFDGDKHEAITNIAVDDDAMKGKVVDVVERGYNLHGKTLRYAKVIVGQ